MDLRQITLKWWDPFKHDQINTEFPVAKPLYQRLATLETSTSSISINKKLKSELKEIGRQLKLQVSQMGEDEEISSYAWSSSQKASSPPQKLHWADYQMPKDPYDLNEE